MRRPRSVNPGKLRVGPVISLLSGLALALVARAAGAAEEELRLRPPQGEIGPGFWEQYGWPVIVIGIIGLLVVAALVVLLTRPRLQPVDPPETAARRGLHALLDRPQDGAWLVQVSRIFRGYLIFAFNLPPGEPTTTEISRSLQASPSADVALALAAAELLRQCDEDKFSPHGNPPRTNAAQRGLELLEKIEAHRRRLARPPAA